jgi:hypothetical protein
MQKYRNNFRKFGGPKHKTAFFYLELELVDREVGEQGAAGRTVGRTVRARASSGAAGAAPAIDGAANSEGAGRGER